MLSNVAIDSLSLPASVCFDVRSFIGHTIIHYRPSIVGDAPCALGQKHVTLVTVSQDNWSECHDKAPISEILVFVLREVGVLGLVEHFLW